MQFQGTSILAKNSKFMESIIGEVTEIELHPNNMNREEGSSLSTSWKPLLQTLKQQKKALSKAQ
jgi:hypothetical protein